MNTQDPANLDRRLLIFNLVQMEARWTVLNGKGGKEVSGEKQQ